MSITTFLKDYHSPREFAFDWASQTNRLDLFEWIDENRLAEDLALGAAEIVTALGGIVAESAGTEPSASHQAPNPQELRVLVGSTRWHVRLAKPHWGTTLHLVAVAVETLRLLQGDLHAAIGATISLASVLHAASTVVAHLSEGETAVYLVIESLSKSVTKEATRDQIASTAEKAGINLPVEGLLNDLLKREVVRERSGVFSCV